MVVTSQPGVASPASGDLAGSSSSSSSSSYGPSQGLGKDQGGGTLTPAAHAVGSSNGMAVAAAASQEDELQLQQQQQQPGPRATLICRPNSHPFQDRHLDLGGSGGVKIGRAVVKVKPSPTNGIFDCRVLSRNHAVLWYDGGKFFLQDTMSSNGTFVNGQRLSKGSEESPPREVCSGDVLQFGVDVVENWKKVTHGSIIATLKLYLPHGKEAIGAGAANMLSSGGSALLPAQDLYQLNQYIQEALAREQLLETKLAVLQRLVGQTDTASSEAWKSVIDEDRLLTRVEILESQLSTYRKGMTEDKLREETRRLLEEKQEYQESAKETLKRLVDEKLEAVKKQRDLKKALSNTEDEFASLKELYERDVEHNKSLATQVSQLSKELEAEKKKVVPENGAGTGVDDEANVDAKNDDSGGCHAKANSEALGVSGSTTLVETSTDIRAINSATAAVKDMLDTDAKSCTTKMPSAATEELNQDNRQQSARCDQEATGSGDSLRAAAAEKPQDVDEEESSALEALDAAVDECGGEYEREEDSTAAIFECSPSSEYGILRERLGNLEDELEIYRRNYEEVLRGNETMTSELTLARLHLDEAGQHLEDKEELIRNLRQQLELMEAPLPPEPSISPTEEQERTVSTEDELCEQLAKARTAYDSLSAENDKLCEAVQEMQQRLEDLEAEAAEKRGGDSLRLLAGDGGDRSRQEELEQLLQEAERKITELLKIKEKFVEVDAEKSNLALNLSELEEEMDVLSLQTRTATACSLIPLAILVLAVVVAYLPSLSNLLGTAEEI